MINNELAAGLRALADQVERLPGGLRLDVDCRAYNVESLAELRAMAALMESPRPNSNCGCHWLKGDFSPGIEVTAFYPAGLLGQKQSKREIVVVSEETDLSLLEVQS